jgi:hypothetical protein
MPHGLPISFLVLTEPNAVNAISMAKATVVAAMEDPCDDAL